MAMRDDGVSRMATIKIQEGERVKRVLHIDIETRSDVDLAKAGVYPYSESPQFKILLFAYAFDDELVAVPPMTNCVTLQFAPPHVAASSDKSLS